MNSGKPHNHFRRGHFSAFDLKNRKNRTQKMNLRGEVWSGRAKRKEQSAKSEAEDSLADD